MSAKLLSAFADENQDLHRQIGCMTGIFQLFDRQHMLTGRRINGQSPKSLPSGAISAELHARSPQVLDKNRSVNENHRFSIESARPSFSSSSCSSSFSSLECNKQPVQEPSLPERSSLETTFKCSPNVHSRVNSRTSHSTPHNLPHNSSSAQPGRESVDFRDVVKDSIYRESNGLSIKTSVTDNVKRSEVKHRDSPRPLPLSKSTDGPYVVAINGRPRTPMNLEESLRALAKLKEAPWYYSETTEPARSSYEAKEAPRFSFDGREASRASMDYRENRAAAKLRELPRLSLDSRESSLQGSNINLRSTSVRNNELERSVSSHRPHQNFASQQDSACAKRPPSVVAKLMGLEAMPNRNQTTPDRSVGLASADTQKQGDISNRQRSDTSRLKPIKMIDENKQDYLTSPKLSVREPPDTPKKVTSQARITIETAPWSQQVKVRNSTQIGVDFKETRTVPRHESVYGEIEKKLKDLEFQQSNKDLRALKQILDAIRAKGLLEPKKGAEQPSLLSGQKTYGFRADELPRKSADVPILKEIHTIPTLIEGISTSKPLESPIVIMKPAKSFNKSSLSTPDDNIFDGPIGLPKVRTDDSVDNRKAPVANQAIKDRVTNNTFRESEILVSAAKERKNINRIDKSSPRAQPRTSRNYPKQHSLTYENDESSTKSSSSVSPRLQQKKLVEKQSRPSTSSGSSKQQRQSRQASESVSPRNRIRAKPKPVPRDGHMNEITEARSSSPLIEEVVSLRSDSNLSNGSQVEVEVTSAHQLTLSASSLSHASLGSRARATADTSFAKQNELNMKVDFSSATVTHEQPSPVSVLDSSFYRDNSPASPVKCSSIFSEDQEPRLSADIHHGEDWRAAGNIESSPAFQPAGELSHSKLKDIEILVKKLRQLSQPNGREDACDHIASLCETQKPDHRYVSEILLASGLLLKDFSTGTAGMDSVQLHKSGFPINPELFLVLEQKKSAGSRKLEDVYENVPELRMNKERAHRKLIFDTVNEILVEKLQLGYTGLQPASWLCRRVAQRIPSGQRLLKELCMEIDQMESNSLQHICIESEEDDGITSILTQDIACQSDGWTGHAKEISGLIVDIERSIFKKLIDDVLNGEIVPEMQAKSNRRRRQLFVK